MNASIFGPSKCLIWRLLEGTLPTIQVKEKKKTRFNAYFRYLHGYLSFDPHHIRSAKTKNWLIVHKWITTADILTDLHQGGLLRLIRTAYFLVKPFSNSLNQNERFSISGPRAWEKRTAAAGAALWALSLLASANEIRLPQQKTWGPWISNVIPSYWLHLNVSNLSLFVFRVLNRANKKRHVATREPVGSRFLTQGV